MLPTKEVARALGPSCMALNECARMPPGISLPGLLLSEALAQTLLGDSHG